MGYMRDKSGRRLDSIDVSAGELGYAEILSTFTTTAIYTSPADVTGLSITLTTTGRPFYVEMGGSATNGLTGVFVLPYLQEGTTVLASAGFRSLATNDQRPVFASRRLSGPAGVTRTFKVTLSSFSAGTSQLIASATEPAWLRVREA